LIIIIEQQCAASGIQTLRFVMTMFI